MKTNLSYWAGLFDGEGSFSIRVQMRTVKGRRSIHFVPRVALTLKYGTWVLDDLQASFGGYIYNYKDGVKRWMISKRSDCIRAANLLLPHLKIKQEIGQRFLDALSLYPNAKGHGGKLDKRNWSLQNALSVACIGMNLNPHKAKPKTHQDRIFRELKEVYAH